MCSHHESMLYHYLPMLSLLSQNLTQEEPECSLFLIDIESNEVFWACEMKLKAMQGAACVWKWSLCS